MVPFWKRRLLAVTLPTGLLCAWCWVLAASQTSESRSPLSSLVVLHDRSTTDLSVVSSFLVFYVPILVSMLVLASPTRRHRLGIAGSLSLAVVALFVLLWLQAGLLSTAAGLGGVLQSNAYRGYVRVLAVNAVAVTLLLSVWRAARRRPREAAVARLGHYAAWLGLAGCAVLLPFAATDLQNRPTEFARLWFNATAMQWNNRLMWHAVVCFLHLALGGATIAFFGRQLLLRHARHHAQHCHRCGYDLTGVEAYSCPECDHPISVEATEKRNSEPPA